MKTFIAGISTIIVIFILCSVANADQVSKRAITEELLKVTNVEQTKKLLFGQMRTIMEQEFTKMGAPEDMRPILDKYTNKILKLVQDSIRQEDYVSIYMQTFSEEELKALVAFYKSPVGQAYIKKMPILIQKSSEMMQKQMPQILKKVKNITDEMIQEMKTEMEKKKSGNPETEN